MPPTRRSGVFVLIVASGKEVICNSLVSRFAAVFYFGNQFFYFHKPLKVIEVVQIHLKAKKCSKVQLKSTI
jgi:hypothetical protein